MVDPRNSSPVIAKGLTKKFGAFTAVSGVDFEIHRGEIFGLLGPNGSGKTTTIRMMLGLIPSTAGSASILGMTVEGNTTRIRPLVGYMSQRFSLYDDLTVLQNLNFYGRAYGLNNSEIGDRIQEAIEMAGLMGKERTLTRELSGGWRQRLALSAAILHQPQVLFLDEPTAGVDPVSRRAFWDLLYELVSQNITILVTTHYMDEAEHCHRLAFIQRGKIIAYGTPSEIKKSKMPGQVLEINSPDPAGVLKVLKAAQNNEKICIEEVELYGSLIHVVAKEMEINQGKIVKELHEKLIDPGQMEIIEPSLEDVFIACMR